MLSKEQEASWAFLQPEDMPRAFLYVFLSIYRTFLKHNRKVYVETRCAYNGGYHTHD